MGPAVALIACTLLAGGALVARSARARAWLLVGALVVAPVILAVHVRDAEQLESLRDQPAVLAAAGVLGLGAVILLALLFARVPAALPVAVALTLPFRIPLAVGGSTSNLLLPLYLVVAAGALAYAAPRITGRAREEPEDGPEPGWLERVLALVLVLYAAQTAYSSDTDRALENVVFFYVPFAALYVLMARTAWTARVAGLTLGVLAGLAAALAAIGYVEYATRHLLLNPKVIASNQLEDYFRVNSLFFDPNIYGRFLAIVLVLLVAWMLWRRRGRDVALVALLIAFLFGGLVLTLSQSSFAALLVGLAVLGALRWSVRGALAAGAAVLVCGLAAVALGTSAFDGGDGSNRATSGRSDLVAGGVGLFTERPLQGWGAGSFSREYRRAEDVSAERATSASHTIPITIAAEQGLAGLAAYLALLAFAFARLFSAIRASGPVRAGCAAAFTALVAHTLMYAAFLEDPLTWALLGAGTALAAAAARTERAPEAP
jgi:O-antigen ligase